MNYQDNVFPAHKAASLAHQFMMEKAIQIKKAENGEGVIIKAGIPGLEGYLNPFMEGDLVTILGRPQNGKTLLAMWMLDGVIRQLLQAQQRDEEDFSNYAAILITLEVPVERAVMYIMARLANISVTKVIRGELTVTEMEGMDIAAVMVAELPLFIIGHSTKRNKEERRKRPNLTPQNIERSLDYIMNEYRDSSGRLTQPAIIVIDYLQRVRNPGGVDRPEHMRQTVDWAKDTALQAGCPVVLGVQASRAVDDLDVKIPGMRHGEWTANVEQTSDFSLGLWMPKTAGLSRTPSISPKIRGLKVRDDLMLISVLKQKDGPAGETVATSVNAPLLHFSEYKV